MFCGIVADAVPHTKVYEDDTPYAFRDIYPGSDSHLPMTPHTAQQGPGGDSNRRPAGAEWGRLPCETR
ncbi:hypothetical protein [Rhodococcus ruber]|uniref:hypothetical protein n=1 Tax=Rhodococcus ruber TaxID=1830 RepID=UPI003558C703